MKILTAMLVVFSVHANNDVRRYFVAVVNLKPSQIKSYFISNLHYASIRFDTFIAICTETVSSHLIDYSKTVA